ncbi:LuxR C-terminal-related transcriptional regulator [Bacteroides fragilis]|uniref:LuxR C-terminal-related transcriptional regulator n=1 Tax=Bacteroides fragilis TaxID=817 RepID=UPI002030A983|nr:LuxR C-terminal-related transcriptional regulator [Bacteroides fragilis]MCM0316354.1 helix-turn-helix transcriptional regulator [Bacteroides fragilis]
MIIEEIEKQVINLLPTSNILLDEVDYSIIEERKNDWIKLSEVTHSVVLVFDCYTNKFVFVSNNIPKLYGLEPCRLFVDGHQPVIEVIHPDDIDHGLLVRKKIYSILRSFSNEEKMNYKAIHEMRVRNIRGEYIRIIEQEQVLALDKSGNIWLMLSVIDIDASHELEIIKSHLYNFNTGEQIFVDLSDTLDEPLTNRELEVLRLMKKGLLSKEIANTLKVSINTINSHRQNILYKLRVDNSIEAVNCACRLGLF